MTVVVSIAGLIMLAFGAFLKIQSDAFDRRLVDIRDDLRSTVSTKEHEEFKRGIEKNFDLIRQWQADHDRTIVPRQEHEARWTASDAFAQLLSNRINEVRNNLSAITTPQSQFTRMESDIAELRRQLNESMVKKQP